MKYGSLIKKITPLFSLTLFIGVIIILKQKLAQYNFTDINNSIINIPQQNVYLAIGLTALGYFIIATYDKVALAYLQYSLSNKKVLTTAFISYAICNTTSFALLIGGGIRYYFYENYHRVPRITIAKIIAFSNFNFWLGLFTVGGLTFTLNPLAVPQLFNLHCKTVRPIGIIFLLIATIYLYYSWRQKSLTINGKTLAIPSFSISLAQITISALDKAIASSVLYVLFLSHSDVSYGSFFGIYVLGITAGIMSHVPGGLGVFETIILYLLPTHITVSDALGSLLAYRGIYFLLPLFVALFWWIIYELKQRVFSNFN